MSQKTAGIVGTIKGLLATLDPVGVKSAEAMSEPGSQGGATTHPSKDVDDSLQEGSEGSHSATNAADVKKDQPLGVDKAEAGGGGTQQDKQTNIGITSKPTGEDSAAETESAKGGKDDPGSSHPARTDNDALDGMKYSSVQTFRHWAKQASALGNSLTASISVNADEANKAAAAKVAAANKSGTAAAPKSAAAASQAAKPEAAAAGGAALADNVTADMDKVAFDNMIVDALAETVQVAEDAAERAVAFIRKQGAAKLAAQKKAEGDDSSDFSDKGGDDSDDKEESNDSGGESDKGGDGGGNPFGGHSEHTDRGEGGGEGGSEGGGDSGGDAGSSGGSDADLLAALSGGGGGGGMPGGMPGGDIGGGDALSAMAGDPSGAGGAGGGMPMPGGDPGMGGGAPGGMPPGGGAPPMDPSMGGGAPGGMPPGGAPGMPGDPAAAGGGMDLGSLTPEQMQMLLAVLQQAQVSPEALEASATAKAAALLRQGWKPTGAEKAAATAWKPKNAAEQKQAQAMFDYVMELTGRSRGK